MLDGQVYTEQNILVQNKCIHKIGNKNTELQFAT